MKLLKQIDKLSETDPGHILALTAEVEVGRAIIVDLLNSADDTGCDGNLTVVDKRYLKKLAKWIAFK